MAKKYKGNSLLTEQSLTFADKSERKFYPYFPSKKLKKAINLAILLRRPLLIMGDPGSGKSILASTLAYEWYHHDPAKFLKKFYRWDIKSRTEAQDGIYLYDAIARLRMTERDQDLIAKEVQFKDNPFGLTKFYIDNRFMEEGPLKKAIDHSSKTEPAILLIDEIDKASIDFPNDLLLELDQFRYRIKETGYISPSKDEQDYPIVIITSNNEKPLPAALLRRCIYHFINFPGEDTLKDILHARYGTAKSDELLLASISLFEKIRKRLYRQDAAKHISTAELINWFEGLLNEQKTSKTIAKKLQQVDDELKEKPDAKVKLPLHYALLKSFDSLFAILPEEEIYSD